MPGEPVVEVKGLSKLYGVFPAVWDITFSVNKGEIVGLLGPNGAGKTTLMQILSGYSPPTFGDAFIVGHDVFRDSLKARAAIGYLPETNPLYPELGVEEYLLFRAKLKGVPRKERKRAIERAMSATYITPRRRQLIGTLSKGLRQRVGLADALVHDPPLLILDEPTSGLDPIQQQEVRNLARELGREKTVLLSTHILPEVERLAQRVLIINAGQLVPSDWVEHVRGRTTLWVEALKKDGAELAVALAGKLGPGVRVDEAEGSARDTTAVTITPPPNEDIRAMVFEACRDAGFTLIEMRPLARSLDEVFAELVLGPDRGGGGG